MWDIGRAAQPQLAACLCKIDDWATLGAYLVYRADVVRGNTHSVAVGYVAWIFGFIGAHRFYYGKRITGTIWFFTLGLFFIGWIIDLFLIPAMDREADMRYTPGIYDYNVAWLLLTFLGLFGIHRMYLGKWITGIIYLATGGLFFIGLLYDLWTLNSQISERNHHTAR